MKRFLLTLVIFVISSQTAYAQKDSLLEIGSPSPNFFLKGLDGSEFYSRDYYGDVRNMPKGRKERKPKRLGLNDPILCALGVLCG